MLVHSAALRTLPLGVAACTRRRMGALRRAVFRPLEDDMTKPLADFFLAHAPSQRFWRSFGPGEGRASVPYRWQPSANLYEVEGGVVVRMDVAGLREGDYRVRLSNGRIIVDGQRRERPPRSILACHQVEIASGHFRSEITLPWDVEADDLEIDYSDGMIEIFVPRRRDDAR